MISPTVTTYKIWKSGTYLETLTTLREKLDALQVTDICWEPHKALRRYHPAYYIFLGLQKVRSIIEPYHSERVL